MRLLCLFVLFVWALCNEDDVEVLTDSDFDSKVAAHETVLVMFYAPWCGHCKRLKPEFAKAAEILKKNDPPIALAKVDCTEDGKDMCSKYGVSGYPTIKIFKNGEFASEYNGPREVTGIVKYMKSQVGPAAKNLQTTEDAEKFVDNFDVGVIGFFKSEDSSLAKAFLKTAEKMREEVRFAYSSVADVLAKYKYTDKIVLFRPKRLHNMFEASQTVYQGPEDSYDMDKWIKSQYHGLCGHRTSDNIRDFKNPLVVAYFEVDYKKNAKGTNYWRNRIMKVGQDFKEQFTLAVSSKAEFQHELNEYGIEFAASDKPVICARDAENKKYVMKEEFSMDTFKKFLEELGAGKLEPYLKSEDIPEDNSGAVKVAVGRNFDELISGKDALIEFYAPWCGHCKKLAPVYDELGEKMKDEDVLIVKMDATANDVPSAYDVRGFPTLFWKPKDGKPQRYEGGRELDDFVKYIAKHSTKELSGYKRDGKAKKTEL